MRRRTVLKGLLAAGGMAPGFRLPLVHAAAYRGKLFVFVQADGGWDPTSFCDPKANTPGEPVINHWAERDEVRQAGGISYAPFARNAAFFEKYHRRMLVINGVDAQTNSHTVGIVHNWSGRNSEGYPTMSSLLAAHYAPDQVVAYLSFGGYAETAGVARFTRIDDANRLRTIATPRVEMDDLFEDADWEALNAARAATDARLAAAPGLLPGDERHRAFHRSALAAEGLNAYVDALPPEHEIGLFTIGGQVFRRVGFTTDRAELLEEAADLHVDNAGGVRFIDGVRETWDRRFDGDEAWPIFVAILTDGIEQSAFMNEDRFMGWVGDLLAGGVTIHSVLWSSRGAGGTRAQTSTGYAVNLARNTGGRYEQIAAATAYEDILRQLAADMAAHWEQASIRYRVIYERPDPSGQSVSVSVTRPGVNLQLFGDRSMP